MDEARADQLEVRRWSSLQRPIEMPERLLFLELVERTVMGSKSLSID